MQPTTPFRDIKLIKSGIKKFLKIKKVLLEYLKGNF